MENKNIIIILLVIIVILVATAGVMFSMQMAKEKSNLAIADKKINVGDSLVVVLTDNHGNPIANETINIKLTDKDGVTIDEKITTNSKGKTKFKMEEKGKYSVECKFDGNNQYASTSITDNITVKKATTEVVSQEQTSADASSSSSGGSTYGPAVDSQGVTREQAEANNMKYMETTIDGEQVGVYVRYDPNTESYHMWGIKWKTKTL